MSDSVEAKPSPAARVLMASVRVYQKILSPAMGGNCRYYPSCSAYGYDAIRLYGAGRGSLMAVKRPPTSYWSITHGRELSVLSLLLRVRIRRDSPPWGRSRLVDGRQTHRTLPTVP